ncbi:MAG: hypothetical protein K6F52_03815 [Clostridia bacterium]|nr:hypothetical protein [Clostridia bacterium]
MKRNTIRLVTIYALAAIAIFGAGYGISGEFEEASASADYDVSEEEQSEKSDEDAASKNAETYASDAVSEETAEGTAEADLAQSPNKADGKSEQENTEQFWEKEADLSVFDNTLFIGDSRTEGFKLYAGVENADYYCGKSMTVDKILEGKKVTSGGREISVYDVLSQKQYDKVFLCEGMNELGWYSVNVFTEKYGQLIDVVKKYQPDAKIYLQAVLPVTDARSEKDPSHNNAQIYWYNLNIIDLAAKKDIFYINAAAGVADENGYLHPDATSDGIHLNKTYCQKWAKYLAAKLEGKIS